MIRSRHGRALTAGSDLHRFGLDDKDTKSRAQRQMKTLFSIWLCRDGVSSTKSKCEKSSAETNENAVFNLAMPGRSIFDEVKVRKSSKAAYENAVFNLAVPGRGIFDKIQDHKIMKRQARRQTTQRQNLQPGLHKTLNSSQNIDIQRYTKKITENGSFRPSPHLGGTVRMEQKITK